MTRFSNGFGVGVTLGGGGSQPYVQNRVTLAASTAFRWASGIGGPADVTEFVLSAWIKPSTFSTASTYVLVDQAVFGTRFYYAHNPSAATYFHMQIGNGTAFADTRATGDAGEGTGLHHHCVIFRKDGTNKLYIDGVDVSNTVNAWVAGETLDLSVANDFRLLSASNGSGYWPAGTEVGDIFIAFDLNGKTDPQLVNSLYNAGTPPSLSAPAPATPGTLVTGLQPAIFFGDTQTAADWNARSNLGSLADPGSLNGSFS